MSIRVLIADDSPFVREVLRDVLNGFSDFEVVGEAADGERAVAMASELSPDVITMDVLMPMVGGLEATRRIMNTVPTPIVVVSDAEDGADALALEAISAGALAVFPKPSKGFDRSTAEQLAELLREANRAEVGPSAPEETELPPQRSTSVRGSATIIGIVASTGGPQTVKSILSGLPSTFPVPIALVQHTAPGFTQALVSWLDSQIALRVVAAKRGDIARAGTVIIAPDGAHLEFKKGGVVSLRGGDRVAGHKPSGTVLLRSLARTFGANALGVVCTGMGSDGADGLAAIEQAGGTILIENPDSAVLYGMPRAALQTVRSPVIGKAHRISAFLRQVRRA